jgi:hypothetical protein
VWSQPKEKALEGGTDEGQGSDNTAMSDMFAMVKTYACLERSVGRLNDAFLLACDEKRPVQCEYDSEIDRLNEELVQMTL